MTVQFTHKPANRYNFFKLESSIYKWKKIPKSRGLLQCNFRYKLLWSWIKSQSIATPKLQEFQLLMLLFSWLRLGLFKQMLVTRYKLYSALWQEQCDEFLHRHPGWQILPVLTYMQCTIVQFSLCANSPFANFVCTELRTDTIDNNGHRLGMIREWVFRVEASFVMLLHVTRQDDIPLKVKYLLYRLLFWFLCLHFMFEERRLHKFGRCPMAHCR